MEIKLPNNYVITSDSMTYILSKYKMVKNKKGVSEMKTTQPKYLNTLQATLNTYKELEIRGSDCKTIPEILEVVKKIDKNIDDVLKGV